MKAFFWDLAVYAVLGGLFLVMNAHSLRPVGGIGWLVLVMVVFAVPYTVWLRLTASGREHDRRNEARLRGAYGIYARAVSRYGVVIMAPALASWWFTRTINGFIWVWLGSLLAVYLYAVFSDRSRKRTPA